MSTELSLSVALVAHANAYCHDCLSPNEAGLSADFFTRRYVSSLQFGGVKPLPPADAALGWMGALRRMNTRRLWLRQWRTIDFVSPVIAAAFANANPTVIFVDCERPHVMRPEWTFGDQSWRVNYHIFAVDELPPVGDVDVDRAAGELRRQLAAARAFVTTHGHPYYADWDEYLARANAILEESDHHSDLLPTVGYSAAAHRLLAAASAAWVFGGMGTWNDMVFSDKAVEQHYHEITGAFFSAVMNGYLVAANSFEPPAGL
jgi:hypothetical protein